MNNTLPDTFSFMPFLFDNSYSRLPDAFFSLIEPTPVSAPAMIRLNHDLATELGIDIARLDSPEGLAILAGNRRPEGSEPLAMAYSGHQFGGFSPQLGDGRAILLGEVDAEQMHGDSSEKASAVNGTGSRVGTGTGGAFKIKCPSCEVNNLIFEEGCCKCQGCGYSQC